MNLASRILLAVLLLVGIASYQFMDWITSELKPRYREAVEESLVDTAYLVAAELANSDLDIAPLTKAFTELERTRFAAHIYDLEKHDVDLRISVTDAAGLVLFDSYHAENVGTDASAWRNVLLTLRGEYGARTTRDDPDNPNSTVLYVSAPIKVDGVIKGVVTVGKPTKSANYFIASAQRRLIKSSSIMLLLLLFVAALLSRIISGPLARLTEYARAVRDGASPPLPALGSGEVARLGEAFEQMRASLEGKNYIEQYVQALTHELKSPLAAIRGAAELLTESGMPEEQRRQFLSNIQVETGRIQGLIEQLLNLAAIEARRGRETFRNLIPATVCEEVIQSMRPRLDQKEIRVRTDFEPSVPLWADPAMLKQALTTVIENAVDFSDRGAEIEVTIRERPPAGIELSVSDHGPGIPDYAKSKVCEKFFSLPRPDTGKKSSGIGLALTAEVMRRHGGTIAFDDRAPRGTVVRLVFPNDPTEKNPNDRS